MLLSYWKYGQSLCMVPERMLSYVVPNSQYFENTGNRFLVLLSQSLEMNTIKPYLFMHSKIDCLGCRKGKKWLEKYNFNWTWCWSETHKRAKCLGRQHAGKIIHFFRYVQDWKTAHIRVQLFEAIRQSLDRHPMYEWCCHLSLML